jgi:hypothetical protein
MENKPNNTHILWLVEVWLINVTMQGSHMIKRPIHMGFQLPRPTHGSKSQHGDKVITFES